MGRCRTEAAIPSTPAAHCANTDAGLATGFAKDTQIANSDARTLARTGDELAIQLSPKQLRTAGRGRERKRSW
jgi:hypothetical protein